MSSYPDQRLRTSAVGCEWTGRQYLGHIRFEIVQGLLRPRWLLPLPVTAFLAYLSAGRLRVDASNVGLGTGVFNQWDLLFHVFGNPYYVLYVLTPLFIYLAADQAADRRLDSAVLMRVGSRRRWWAAKGLALGAASTVYTLLMFGLCAAIGVAGFGWEPTWSEGIRFFVSVDPYIVPGALLLSPGAAVIYLAGLLALGWLGLGMFALSVCPDDRSECGRVWSGYAGAACGDWRIPLRPLWARSAVARPQPPLVQRPPVWRGDTVVGLHPLVVWLLDPLDCSRLAGRRALEPLS